MIFLMLLPFPAVPDDVREHRPQILSFAHTKGNHPGAIAAVHTNGAGWIWGRDLPALYGYDGAMRQDVGGEGWPRRPDTEFQLSGDFP